MSERTEKRAKVRELGWTWSAAHNGLINEAHQKSGELGWGRYIVAKDLDEALDISNGDA